MKAKLEASKMKNPPRRQGERWIVGRMNGYNFFQAGRPDGLLPLRDHQKHDTELDAVKAFLYSIELEDSFAIDVIASSFEEMALIFAKQGAMEVVSGRCAICDINLTGQSSVMVKKPGTIFSKMQVCCSCAGW
jgi:hypothetical protein